MKVNFFLVFYLFFVYTINKFYFFIQDTYYSIIKQQIIQYNESLFFLLYNIIFHSCLMLIFFFLSIFQYNNLIYHIHSIYMVSFSIFFFCFILLLYHVSFILIYTIISLTMTFKIALQDIHIM